MPVSVIDTGSNNVVDIHPDHLELGQGTITLRGSGNVVRLGRPYVCGAIHIEVSDGSTVTMSEECILSTVYVTCRRAGNVKIGAKTSFNGGSALIADEGKSISIGDACMFADGARVWSSDMHSMIDVQTGARVNAARDVVIGDRVWIADGALVLKGSHIGDGSILGAASVLAGKVPENCVAAGNPARVVRRGVTWSRELLASEPVAKPARRGWFSWARA